MMTEFQFRLIDTGSPVGELRADRLIELVQNLQRISTRIGRATTRGEARGRLRKETEEMVVLSIGLTPGSTTLQWQRAPHGSTLDLKLPHEEAFDRTFENVISALASNERPSWFDDGFASDVGALRNALERTARTVEFSSDGTVHTTFCLSDTTPETWAATEPAQASQEIRFVGQLRAVNLDTHRLHVTDDVGNRVALPDVSGDLEVGALLGQYVEVTGFPEYTEDGHPSHIRNATVVAAEPVITPSAPPHTDIAELLASAPGPDPHGVAGLTDEEAEGFLKAIGL